MRLGKELVPIGEDLYIYAVFSPRTYAVLMLERELLSEFARHMALAKPAGIQDLVARADAFLRDHHLDPVRPLANSEEAAVARGVLPMGALVTAGHPGEPRGPGWWRAIWGRV